MTDREPHEETAAEATPPASRRARRPVFEYAALALLLVAFVTLAVQQSAAPGTAADLPLVAWSPVPRFVPLGNSDAAVVRNDPDLRTAAAGAEGPFGPWDAVWQSPYADLDGHGLGRVALDDLTSDIDIVRPRSLFEALRHGLGFSTAARDLVASYAESRERMVVGTVTWAKYVQRQ